MIVRDNRGREHAHVPIAGNRVLHEHILDRVDRVFAAAEHRPETIFESCVAPVLGAIRIEHVQRQVVDQMLRGRRVAGGLVPVETDLERRLTGRHRDLPDVGTTLLQHAGLVDDEGLAAVIPHVLQVGKAPALVLAPQVGACSRKRILVGADNLQSLERREVRAVLVDRATRRAQDVAERTDARSHRVIGEHLDRQHVVATDHRRGAGCATEVRGPVAAGVTSRATEVGRANVVVVGTQRRLDPAIARRANARIAAPRVVGGVGVVEVDDAADRKHVLRPSLAGRTLVAGVGLALRPRDVMIEHHVIRVGRVGVVVERRGIAPRRGGVRNVVDVDEIIKDLVARRRSRSDLGVELAAIGSQTAHDRVAGTVAPDNAGGSVAVLVRNAGAADVDAATGKVDMVRFDTFIYVRVDAGARIATLGFHVVAATLDARVIHVEVQCGRAVDPQDFVEPCGLQQLRARQRDFDQ